MDALIERRKPRWGRVGGRLLRWVLVGVPTLFAATLIASGDARYLGRAGVEELRILVKRRPIAKLVADSKTPAPLRQRLSLVLATRAYAADSLSLRVGDTYTTYVDVARDTLLLVLSASRRDRLRAYTWRYPIVGTVPYKGLFAVEQARRAAAEAFFRSRGDSLDAARAAARWRDERTLDLLYAELARRLDSAYAQGFSGPALERARATLFGWSRAQLTGPVGQSLETYDWRWFAKAPLNNAVVIAQRLYRMNLNLFEEVYLHSRANLPEAIRAIQVRVLTQPAEDPYKALYSKPAAGD